ncbi:MAG: DinB family protein [Chloroflexi bacterium]|nr:DinB family protein [Chloroflexota bacterium]
MMQDHEHGDPTVLTAFFAHNAWANLKLLDFCENLSDEQLDATTIGGFGSIRETLLHIVGAEVSYVERVNGRQPAEPVSFKQFPGFSVLKDAVRWANEELLQLALSAHADTKVRQRPPRMLIEYNLASLIPQAITHSTEHRTHISVIITQLGMEPPDTSVWNYLDEIGEIQELGAAAEGA